jgi:uncharacterized protein YaeQ
MALGATVFHIEVSLSDVDRGVYEALDLRLALHPSETLRYMLTRTLAYCLSYEEGIAFSKGGLSDADEPPVSVRDRTGLLVAWIDVGTPSAERLHKASKAARRVSVFTHEAPSLLRREAASRAIHRADAIEVWRLDRAQIDRIEPKIQKRTELQVLRDEGQLYLTIGGDVFDGPIERSSLAEEP